MAYLMAAASALEALKEGADKAKAIKIAKASLAGAHTASSKLASASSSAAAIDKIRASGVIEKLATGTAQ